MSALLRLARWLGWTALVLVLLYGFTVLGAALWLRRALTAENLAASTGCWSRYDALPKTDRRRDGRVLYVLRGSPIWPESHEPGMRLSMALVELAYLTWWPVTERERLFAQVTPQMRRRPCPSWKP